MTNCLIWIVSGAAYALASSRAIIQGRRLQSYFKRPRSTLLIQSRSAPSTFDTAVAISFGPNSYTELNTQVITPCHAAASSDPSSKN